MSVRNQRIVRLTATAGGRSKTWEGLDIAFDIRRSLRLEPNTAAITIWNLNEDSQRLIADSSATVTLEAGHIGRTGIIFAGDVDEVDTGREGDDYPCVITCADGGRALRRTIGNISIARDSAKADVVDELVTQLGLPRGYVEPIAGTLKQGYARLAQLAPSLATLVEGAGAQVSVQSGAIQVVGSAGLPGTPVGISQRSGMVGSPRRQTDKGQPDGIERPGVIVRTLLDPALVPGRAIQLDARFLSGRYVVQRLRHVGGNFGQDFYTDLEAV